MAIHSKEAHVDQRLIKALGHPLRMRVLGILNVRVASPSELAQELGEPLGNVAYHVKILEDVNATWLDLDDEAYAEVAGLLNTLVARAQELHAESAPRLAGRSPSERHATALMIMQVHRTPGDG